MGTRNSAGSVQRFAADGDTIYCHDYFHPETTATIPLGLAIDADDDSFYVVGYGKGVPKQMPWIAKWDWAGDEVWNSDVTMEGEIAHAKDVLIDPQGWIRVVGADRVDEVFSIVITTFDPEGPERDRVVWSLPGAEVRALGAAVRDDVLYVVGGTSQGEDSSEVLLAAFEI